MKVQAIATVQRLRNLSQIFSIDEAILGMHGSGGSAQEKPQVFKYEMGEYYENFFCAYNPAYQADGSHASNFVSKDANPHLQGGSSCIAIDRCEIFDFYTLPSTVTLAKCETISYEESAKLNTQYPSFEFTSSADENEPEKSIKASLPKFEGMIPEYPKEEVDKDRQCLRVVDFQNSYDYSQTAYARMWTYYAMIERIFYIRYTLQRLTSNL